MAAMAVPLPSEKELDATWEAAFGPGSSKDRPILYMPIPPEGSPDQDFSPLNDSNSFKKDLATLSHRQLQAVGSNIHSALASAQHEFLNLDSIIKEIEDKSQLPDPNVLEDLEVFEEEKEAALYGYVRRNDLQPPAEAIVGNGPNPLAEKWGIQDPFKQGGFVPNKLDYQRKLAKARNPLNPDDWEPIERNGMKLIPRINRDLANPPKPRAVRVTRKRKAGDITGDDTDRPTTPESVNGGTRTPIRVVNKHLNVNGLGKEDRAYSESPSIVSTIGPGVLATTGRRRNGHIGSQTPLLTSASATPAPDESPTPKRRKQNTANHDPSPAPDGTVDLLRHKWKDLDLLAAIKADHSWLHDDPDVAMTRKEKIMNSKYPVRTLAMYRKWGDWRKDGADKRPRKNLKAKEKSGSSMNGKSVIKQALEDTDAADGIRLKKEDSGEVGLKG